MFEPLAPILEYEDIEERYGKYVSDWEEKNGRRISNNTLVMGNAPVVGLETRHFLDSMWNVSLSLELRFFVRYVVSNTNQCRYCMSHQIGILKDANMPIEKIKATSDFENSDLFSPKEKAAMSFARALVLDAGAVPQRVYDQLVEHYTPQERVELTLVVGTMNLINMFNDGLRIPLEDESILDL